MGFSLGCSVLERCFCEALIRLEGSFGRLTLGSGWQTQSGALNVEDGISGAQ